MVTKKSEKVSTPSEAVLWGLATTQRVTKLVLKKMIMNDTVVIASDNTTVCCTTPCTLPPALRYNLLVISCAIVAATLFAVKAVVNTQKEKISRQSLTFLSLTLEVS